MPKSLQEYAEWLADRDLMWPKPPPAVPSKAKPFIKPLEGIRAVTWSVYGTLLRISDGELLFHTPDTTPLQVALDKTIEEFNMWNSMFRKPGAPWELLYEQYLPLVQQQQMQDTQQKGDVPEVDSSRIWRKIFARLGEKDYSYDMNLYGDPEELSDKVAYFFHSSLQGVEAAPHARDALQVVADSPIKQSLLADAQPFTLVQMLRELQVQGTLPPLGALLGLGCMALSFQEGLKMPSPSLYKLCVERFEDEGISPHEVLHVSSRLPNDLAVAKQVGMRTALYAADMTSLKATKADIKDPQMRPDRLLTDLIQIRDILSI